MIVAHPLGLDRLLGERDLLVPGAGQKQPQLGLLLLDFGLGAAQLGPVVARREPRDLLAGLDPVAFRDQHLGDDRLDLGTDVGVVHRQHLELARHGQLHLAKPQPGREHAKQRQLEGAPPHGTSARQRRCRGL